MSCHSNDAWHPYADLQQAPHPSPDRRQSHSLYGSPNHQSGMSFTNPFAPQLSPLNIETTSLTSGPCAGQDSATTPTGYIQPLSGDSVSRFLTQHIKHDSWTPLHLTPQNLNTAVGHGSAQQPQFITPRSPAQSDTASFVTGPRQQRDSAYCSTASPTVPDPVTANQDCPDMREMFSEMPPLSATLESPSTPARSRRAPTSVPSQADEGSIILPEDRICPHCGAEPRLKSELKKHMLRHIRPFRCKIPDCNGASEGFTTSNDLDRHNRSVHNIFPKNAKVYTCAAKNCAEGEKMWPRYDNFKQHCERMHKGDNLEALVSRSERPAPAPPAEVQQILDETSRSQTKARPQVASETASLGNHDLYNTQPSIQQSFYDEDLYGGSETGSFVSFPPHSSTYNDDQATRMARNAARDHLRQSYANGDGQSASSAKLSSQGSRSVSSRPPPEVVVHQPDVQKSRQNELAHMFPDYNSKALQFDETIDSRAIRYQQLVNESQQASQLLTPNSASFGRSRSLSSGSSGSPSRSPRGRSATVIGGNMPNMPKMPGKRKSDASNASSSIKRVRCKWPGCEKTGMRPCELKSVAL